MQISISAFEALMCKEPKMNDGRDTDYASLTTTKTKKTSVESKAKAVGKYKKAPGAPRRFKSAFIFFSTEKHKEIRQGLGQDGAKEKTTNVAKMVSESWKNLGPEEREVWEEKARRDKARYEVEKQTYHGPWKVAADKRSPKDPNAPKRPMSAFLSFSNSKRAAVKRQNPTVTNAEVSRILSRMWKGAPEDERQMHIEQEFKLRQRYKSAMGEWRTNAEREKTSARLTRENNALKTLEAQKQQFMDGDSAGILRQQEDEATAVGHAHAAALFQEQRAYERGLHGRGSNYYHDHQAYDNYESGQQESKASSAFAGIQQSLNEASALSLFQGGLPPASASMPNMLDRSFLASLQHHQNHPSLQHHQNHPSLQWAQRDNFSSQLSSLAYGSTLAAASPYSNIGDPSLSAYSGYHSSHGVNPYLGNPYGGYDQQHYDGDHSRPDDSLRNLFDGRYQG